MSSSNSLGILSSAGWRTHLVPAAPLGAQVGQDESGYRQTPDKEMPLVVVIRGKMPVNKTPPEAPGLGAVIDIEA